MRPMVVTGDIGVRMENNGSRPAGIMRFLEVLAKVLGYSL